MGNALKAARVAYFGENKRRKWSYRCAECGGLFAGKEVRVDHIVPVGRLKDWPDVVPWLQRLLVDSDGLQVLCADCHHTRTQEQRHANVQS